MTRTLLGALLIAFSLLPAYRWISDRVWMWLRARRTRRLAARTPARHLVGVLARIDYKSLTGSQPGLPYGVDRNLFLASEYGPFEVEIRPDQDPRPIIRHVVLRLLAEDRRRFLPGPCGDGDAES